MTGHHSVGSSSSQGRVCSTCALSIVAPTASIKCTICAQFFHGTVTCAGVQANAIKAVSQHLGPQGAFAYRCIKCRVMPAASGVVNSDLAGAVGQLSEMFSGLAATVAGLAGQVECLASRRPTPDTQPPANPNTPHLDPQFIRSEIREILERDRRSDSIIVRGISTPANNGQPNTEFMNSFNAVVSELLPGKTVALTDFIVIKKDLVRAKIVDSLLRRDLLSVATNLRTSPRFSSVFISRDLTYSQRGVNKAKRDAAKARLLAEQRAQPQTSANLPPNADVHVNTTASQHFQPNLVHSTGPTPLSASATVPGHFFG